MLNMCILAHKTLYAEYISMTINAVTSGHQFEYVKMNEYVSVICYAQEKCAI